MQQVIFDQRYIQFCRHLKLGSAAAVLVRGRSAVMVKYEGAGPPLTSSKFRVQSYPAVSVETIYNHSHTEWTQLRFRYHSFLEATKTNESVYCA